MERKNRILRNALRVKYLAAILLLGGAKSSTAQQPPQQPAKLTLQQAEMMALHVLAAYYGRGPHAYLVASSRLQAQAGDVLHAQSVVRVAQETIAARQLLLDQVTALAQNN